MEDAKKSVNPNDGNERVEDRQLVHVHYYITEVDVACEHQHVVMGVSAPERERGNNHDHRIKSRTSFYSEHNDEEGHWHWIDVVSDPGVELGNGHTHYFCGETSHNAGHSHCFQGVLSLGPMEQEECEHICPKECDSDDDIEMHISKHHHHKHPKRPNESPEK